MRIRQTWLRCDAGDKRQRKRSTPNVVKYHRKKWGRNQVNPGVAHFQVEFWVLGINVPIYLVKSPGLLGSVPILGVYLVLYFFYLENLLFRGSLYLRGRQDGG